MLDVSDNLCCSVELRDAVHIGVGVFVLGEKWNGGVGLMPRAP
jgi:hypothetical protein